MALFVVYLAEHSHVGLCVVVVPHPDGHGPVQLPHSTIVTVLVCIHIQPEAEWEELLAVPAAQQWDDVAAELHVLGVQAEGGQGLVNAMVPREIQKF